MSYDPFNNAQTGSFFGFGVSSQHENAVSQFASWLRDYMPEAYDAMSTQRPELLNGRQVIIAGDMQVPQNTLSGLADGTVDAGNTAVTNWGQDVLSFLKQAVPTYYQAKTQQALIDLNIQRAEQGLPPISTNEIAPQVNVGVSNQLQTLAYVAVAGLVAVGLFSAFKRGSR